MVWGVSHKEPMGNIFLTEHADARCPLIGRIRRRAALLLSFACAVFFLLAAPAEARRAIGNFELHNFKIGGDFALTNQFGKQTRLSAYKGKVVAITFGYTHCPDICPTILADLNKVVEAADPKGEAVQVLFITVDPARDTAAHLKEYLPFFNKKFIGLTGSVEEIREVARKFSAAFQKQEGSSKAGYLMGHTSFVYLVSRKGEVKYILPHDIGKKILLDGVRLLLKEKA